MGMTSRDSNLIVELVRRVKALEARFRETGSLTLASLSNASLTLAADSTDNDPNGHPALLLTEDGGARWVKVSMNSVAGGLAVETSTGGQTLQLRAVDETGRPYVGFYAWDGTILNRRGFLGWPTIAEDAAMYVASDDGNVLLVPGVSPAGVKGQALAYNTDTAVYTQVTPGKWNNLTLTAGWVDFTGRQRASYRLNGDEVEMRGQIRNGTFTAGTVVGTLPLGFRPPANDVYPAPSAGTGQPYFYVQTNGQILLYGAASNAGIGLRGIRFSVRSA